MNKSSIDFFKNQRIVTPGEIILKNADAVLTGHGTYVDEKNRLIASVCGYLEKIDKLITVKPLKARYVGAIGDVVVGRITKLEESKKRWKIDIQGRTDAILQLSSVNLGASMQRRKTVQDTLKMRTIYQENDLIAAEIQRTNNGQILLQTRSAQYGKLENGIFLKVHSSLVKKCKKHFHVFPFGIQMILGRNGYIWLTKAVEPEKKDASGTSGADEYGFIPFMSTKKVVFTGEIPIEDRKHIIQITNAINWLNDASIPISPEIIMIVIESSEKSENQETMIKKIEKHIEDLKEEFSEGGASKLDEAEIEKLLASENKANDEEKDDDADFEMGQEQY